MLCSPVDLLTLPIGYRRRVVGSMGALKPGRGKILRGGEGGVGKKGREEERKKEIFLCVV